MHNGVHKYDALNEGSALQICSLKCLKNVKTPCTTDISGRLRGEEQLQTGFMGEKLLLTALMEGHLVY